MVRVLIVEDSPVVREFLVHVLGSDPEIRVVGTVADGEDALAAVKRWRPDVISMDVHMPRMDGLEATRRIMESEPTPIVIVSGSGDPREVAITFDAIEAGALAALPRPRGIGHEEHERTAREFVRTLKTMAEVKVIKRWPQEQREGVAAPAATRAPAKFGIVAIGASTGGPPVLHAILSALPAEFPVPIVVVQHIAPGFVQGFADWLAQSSRLRVKLAAHGEKLLPGHVYMAPDGFHTTVERGGRIALRRGAPEDGLCPSASRLFRSVAEVYGREAIAGLLSGMGRDGAEELRLLKEKDAITFVQDKHSSVVHGMPGEAIRLDAAMYVLPPEKIAGVLENLTSAKR